MCEMNKLPDFPQENRIIYDWVSITTRKHTLYQLTELLGFKEFIPWETVRGSHGFQWRQYFCGISIHFNVKEFDFNYMNLTPEQKEEAKKDDFIWLEMSGQGCRAFETYGSGNYEQLFDLVRSDPDNIHVTRLDVAFDDMTGVFDINTVCDESRQEHFTARSKKYQAIYSNGGNSVLFGSRQSNVLIRIYDKAKERGYMDPDLHWIRCEIQLKDVNALGFVEKLEFFDLRDVYLGVINNYLSFKTPTEDSNKRRWPVADWWEIFIGDAVRMSVWSKPGVDYNLSACERYVMTQPIGSIKTLITIFGHEGFLEAVKQAPAPKNPKYKQLIASVMAETKLNSGETKADKLAALSEGDQMTIITELRNTYLEAHEKAKQK